jgi:hypothetical protein
VLARGDWMPASILLIVVKTTPDRSARSRIDHLRSARPALHASGVKIMPEVYRPTPCVDNRHRRKHTEYA